MLKIIDTHVHVWDLDNYRLPWLDGEGPVLARTWTPTVYLREAAKGEGWEVEQAVYIEVDMAADERERECVLACELVDDPGTPFGGACISGDLTSPDFAAYIEPWAAKVQIKGLRQVLHVPSAKPGTCLSEQFLANVRLLGELGLVYEGCVRCGELADLAVVARECPDTCVVLDHMGIVDADVMAHAAPTPDEAAYQRSWRKDMAELGRLPNVVCKVSGLNPAEPWSSESLGRAVDVALDAFDADKLMYASNFPVLNVSMTLTDWTDAMLEITEGLGAAAREALFSGNARRVYGLA